MKTSLMVLSIGIASCMAGHVQADTLTPIGFGKYDDTGAFDTFNYAAGVAVSGATVLAEFRSFAVFDLSPVSDTVVSGQLRVFNHFYHSVDPDEQFTLFHVSTAPATVLAGGNGVLTFNDLGTGPSYGTGTTSPADVGSFVSVALNATAINDLNLASGQFAFGLALTSIDPPALGNSQLIFTTTLPSGVPTFELVLEIVPEPDGLLLAVCGAAAVVAIAWRRRGRESA